MNDVVADLPLLARSLLALAAVMALLLGVRWTLARQGMGGNGPAATSASPLSGRCL